MKIRASHTRQDTMIMYMGRSTYFMVPFLFVVLSLLLSRFSNPIFVNSKHFLLQVLENICYCAHHYNTEKARCTKNPDNFEKSVNLGEYFGTKDCSYE